MKLNLWPLLGFMNAVPRQDVPLNAITGPSLDWLVGRQRYRRRGGTTNYGASLTGGVLESKWGALARRMIAATLLSMTDLFPTPLTLYVNETTKHGTLSFRSTNGTDNWRVVGQEFDTATTYPDTGVPTHRVMPMVYRNEYGGLTVHRLNTAEYRAHMAAGSRDIAQVGDEIVWPGYDSAPARWNGGFGDDPCTVFPLGLIPPLQMPVCDKGNDLGAVTQGPFKGSNAWFYSMCYENERGELSMFTVPRPIGSAWAGYEGFGYFQVDSANLTHYFDGVAYSGIADGPPGTVYKRLMRSTKVDLAATGAGAIVQPSVADLAFFARIPQGVHEYFDADGNDAALNYDPRIQEMYKAGLQFPPCARSMGGFDGHFTLGHLRTNPHAMFVAPWDTGNLNAQIDDDALYGSTSYFVAVTSTQLVLRSVTGGVPTDTTQDLTNITLRQLVDRVNADASYSTVSFANCDYIAGQARVDLNAAPTGVAIGDEVVSSDFPSGTKVVRVAPAFLGAQWLLLDQPATASDTAATVVFRRRTGAIDTPWASGIVPGADGEESTDALLRTYAKPLLCAFTLGSPVIDLSADDSELQWITPGMLVYRDENGEPSRGFSLGTVVTEVDPVAKTVTVSTNALRNDLGGPSESVLFAYNTESATPLDAPLATEPGFVRMFSNAWPAPLFFNLDYLDRLNPKVQDSTFSAASPGYAQDGVNTWLRRNWRGGRSGLGPLMGFADIGPAELQFYARGRMLLVNPRTGLTHSDEDYTKQVRSWNRGARSPYAICAGNRWAVFMSDGGFFACEDGPGEVCISGRIYDPSAAPGSRGELEYALEACVAASESGSDAYKVFAQAHGSILYVRYFSSAAATYPDREIRYDFSEGVKRGGVAELLQDDGRPFPWSAPLTLRASVSAMVPKADGVHHLAAIDSNGGTGDGRVDEFDTGTEDDAGLVQPVGYTGLFMPDNLDEIQPTMAYSVHTKAGCGFDIALTSTPESEPADSLWDALDIESSETDSFGRTVAWLAPEQSLRRAAIAVRIWDDGTGPCTELSQCLIDAKSVASTTSSPRK